jgi:hypothetical protein
LANEFFSCVVIDASTHIKRNNEPAVLSDLHLNDPANAEYDVVTAVAKEIEAGDENGDGADGGTDGGSSND